MTVLLASASEIRFTLLKQAGVDVVREPVRVDEETLRQALEAENVPPRDMADHLAEQKARKASAKADERHLVLGCDQILEFEGSALGKAASATELTRQLELIQGKPHKLHAAAVIYEDSRPVWRHIASATLHMRPLTPAFIADYVARNWDTVRFSVGGYQIEAEGPRLFTRIDGSHFAVLGLPLLEILSYLCIREELQT